jgi:hypothetical protein
MAFSLQQDPGVIQPPGVINASTMPAAGRLSFH